MQMGSVKNQALIQPFPFINELTVNLLNFQYFHDLNTFHALLCQMVFSPHLDHVDQLFFDHANFFHKFLRVLCKFVDPP